MQRVLWILDFWRVVVIIRLSYLSSHLVAIHMIWLHASRCQAPSEQTTDNVAFADGIEELALEPILDVLAEPLLDALTAVDVDTLRVVAAEAVWVC